MLDSELLNVAICTVLGCHKISGSALCSIITGLLVLLENLETLTSHGTDRLEKVWGAEKKSGKSRGKIIGFVSSGKHFGFYPEFWMDQVSNSATHYELIT